MDMSKSYNKILNIDVEKRTARIQPGLVLDTLRAAAQKYGLTFGPDPATHTHCTLGGMIGNNSCGVHSVTAGKTVDNVESLDILTYAGDRMTVGPTGDEAYHRVLARGGREAGVYQRLRDPRD